MKITDLKGRLSKLQKDELLKIIIDLYKKNTENKEWLDAKFIENYELIAFEKYKKQIVSEFYPERGDPKLRYSNMRSALKNFRDISSNPNLIADLMIAHVESGVSFTNQYGDIDERFYDNISGMYFNLFKHLYKYNLLDEYRNKCLGIVKTTSGIGWGFHEQLSETYYSYYGN